MRNSIDVKEDSASNWSDEVCETY